MAECGRGDISDNRQVGNGGTSNTVEVRGFSANINKELLEMYFANSRRSGGGDTEEVQIGDGVAYITFKEAEVAQRVVSCSNHQVDGQSLTVTLLHPSPLKSYYKNRVLIQGLNNAITEEMLTNFLQTVTEAKVREFLYGEDEGRVVMMLSDNIDIAQLEKIFREKSIERAFLQVARVDISNCIIVQNIQSSTSHDVILYYFEDKGRSGGGDVERVEMKAEERYCLVYFEDHCVIDRVLSQSHKVDGADVEVHLHHECLGQRSSRNRFDSYLRISSPGKTDSAVLEEENIDKANEKTPNSVSSNPEKESDFVEVQKWQENDGKNCTLTLWIKYKRAPDMKIVKDMKKVPCSWNFHLYWNFYTKAKQGQQMLHEIISKYNCSVAVCSDEEDLFIFEISAKSFEQESDVIHFIHDVLDSIYRSAQQLLYFDVLLVDQRMQGDVLQLMKQRKELDGARIELMGQQDNGAMCVICTKKDKMSVLHVVTEIIHNVRECFENHEEVVPVDHKWQKVMKTFGYIQKLGDKFPKVTVKLDGTKPAILLKGPRDQSKAAADHLMELIGTAQSEVKEDIFSPSCQFDIFTYPEMCDFINKIMELSIVWIPNQLTKKIHLFSKKVEKIKSIDKAIEGCVQERVYPLQRDQSVHSPEICNSLETLKKKHTGKILVNWTHRGLLVTTADDIFKSVDDAMLEIISKQTDLSKNILNDSPKYKSNLDFDHEEDSLVDIAIVTGSILDQQVQIIVNSTTKDLNLADGNLTSVILTAAGSTIQDECRRVHPRGIKFGEIAVTTAGKLEFRKIFHGALYPPDNSDLHLLSLRTMMKNCLEKAKEERCHSIAFPALGIGRLHYPVDVVAKEMFRAVTTYAMRCGIKYVVFVLPEDDAAILSIFKEMGNTMKKSLQDSQDCQPEYEVSLDDCKVKIAITAGNKVTMCDVDVVFGNPSAGTHVETLIFKYTRAKITVNRDPKKWSETQYLHSKNMHNLFDGLFPTVIYMKKMKFTSCTLHLSKLDKEDNCKSAITKVIQALDECRSDHGDLERVTILISNYMIQKLRPWLDENVIASSSKKSSKTKFMGFFGSKTKTTWKKLSPANRDARLTYVQITGTDCDVVKRSSDAVQKGFRELTIQKKEESVKNEEMEEVSYRIPEKMDSHGVQPSDRFS